MTASRVMCMASHGEPPSDTHEAAHSCGNGNKGCVNPKHLYWATPTENQTDRVLHGTSNRGSAQWNSKLKIEDVLHIRELLLTTSQKEIATLYGVSQSAINNIKTRKSWAWLD